MRLENRLWNLGNLFVIGLVLLSARMVYWPLVRGVELDPSAVALGTARRYSDSIKEEAATNQQAVDEIIGGSAIGDLPQPVVQRIKDLMDAITRGSVFDRNGRALVYDIEGESGDRTRFYAEPSLAHVIGYVSGLRSGVSGLELTYNETLLGLDRLDSKLNQLIHQEIQGGDLVLTIDTFLQRQAEEALGSKAGAIVVLDAASGAVLAMASAPGFDPNRVLEPGYIQGLEDDCGGAPECSGVFLNRATQALYTPGSTFKTVVLLAALDSGQVTPGTIFEFGPLIPGPQGGYYIYEVDGGVIPDPNHAEDRLDLEMSYAKSANAAFARIGDEMASEVLIDYAARFWFSAPAGSFPPFEIEVTPPLLANDLTEISRNNLLRASTAIGQGEILANPFALAMVVLAIVNEGDLPVPYFVEEIRSPDGDVIQSQPGRDIVQNLISPETAAIAKEMMETVVERGSGVNAAVSGMTVGGKTGTAQLGGDQLPHAWFIGFAETADRSVVISVVLENAGEGHEIAAPVFSRIADVAINQLGRPVGEVTGQLGSPQDPPEENQAGTATDLPVPDILRDPGKIDIVNGPGTCLGNYEGFPGSGEFSWPVAPEHRSLVGGDFIPGHPGIDLGAPTGAPVYAADSGVVVFANWSGVGYGNTVVLDHGNGFRTLYAHLSQIGTYCGAQVEAGATIGLADNTGNSSGPHLHFEIRVPNGFLNPWDHLPTP